MPFNGAGAFLRVHDWTDDANAAINIRADRFDEEDDGMATGLSNCITKDGQTTVTANIPMNSKKLTGLAAGTASGDAISYAQSGASLAGLTLSAALTYGGVTLTNNVTGTGKMVLSDSPAFTTLIAVPKARIGTNGTDDPTFDRVNTVAVIGGAILSRSVAGNGSDFGMDGTSGTNIRFYTDNGSRVAAGTISSNGSTTAYNTSSDVRLKDNIADAGDAGALIDALRVRSWDWKGDGRHEQFGFVAQEEVLVAPFAVRAGDDDPDTITEPWGRDDSKLVPLLVKEVQSLRIRLAAIEDGGAT